MLDGSHDLSIDTYVTHAGITRSSTSDLWFSLTNPYTGDLGLQVEGEIVGGALTVAGGVDLSGATVTLSGATLTGGTYSSGTLSAATFTGGGSLSGVFSGGTLSGGSYAGTHSGDGSGLSSLNADNIDTGSLAGARLPADTPWDCRWYITASNNETVTASCADGRDLVSGFCYTTDTSCGVGWYRPLGLYELTTGTHLPNVGTGMTCVFSGTCDDIDNPNKAMSLCCQTD
jgi:hypothetical protein